MKTVKFLFPVFLFIAFLSCSKPEPVTIRVEGMTCEGCENAIEINLKELKGINFVEASHIEKKVDVAFDSSKVSLADIKLKISETGYKVIEDK